VDGNTSDTKEADSERALLITTGNKRARDRNYGQRCLPSLPPTHTHTFLPPFAVSVSSAAGIRATRCRQSCGALRTPCLQNRKHKNTHTHKNADSLQHAHKCRRKEERPLPRCESTGDCDTHTPVCVCQRTFLHRVCVCACEQKRKHHHSRERTRREESSKDIRFGSRVVDMYVKHSVKSTLWGEGAERERSRRRRKGKNSCPALPTTTNAKQLLTERKKKTRKTHSQMKSRGRGDQGRESNVV
jgi:hypothetical protein